ncbi:excalibur calcium-binding domain-containing protein [uncultured Friedmanniella sp.]|uniref:excalibur calcium-binding domain-containing protein n=1 Tax=uncultured Friedmanniella sp. TaxID=335381 RepID=UPI0035C95A8F
MLALPLAATTTTADAASYHYKNCTKLHKDFKHGVGKKGAKDKTSGTPVTNFKKSTSIYKKAIAYNKRLDADKDGIACEKR